MKQTFIADGSTVSFNVPIGTVSAVKVDGSDHAYTEPRGGNVLLTMAHSTNTLTDGNATNVDDGDVVEIDGVEYTFKTALTPTEGEVLIGASADASLTNLVRAINHTGTPDTDYSCAAAHPTVSAAAVASHATTLTAIDSGTAGDAITLSTTAASMTPGAATFSGGEDPPAQDLLVDITYTMAAAAPVVTGSRGSNAALASLLTALAAKGLITDSTS